MEFNEYQNQAKTTATYPEYNILDVVSYLGLGLAGEAGEVANKAKKILRGDWDITDPESDESTVRRKMIADELGDCLWYISEFARRLGFSFEDIAAANLAKLRFRQAHGIIKGDGDRRGE